MTHPSIRELFENLSQQASFRELARRAGRGGAGRLSLSGLTPTAKAVYLALLWQAARKPLLVISDSGKRAEALFEPLASFFHLLAPGREEARPLFLPALDTLPFQNLSPHSDISAQRAVALWRLATRPAPITVTPVAGALLRLEPPAFYRQLALRLRVQDEIPMEDLIAHLESIGYGRREPVEMVGEYSIRGGILDVFPAEAPAPVRLEMFGDFVESMRRFDPETQRSTLKLEDALILPLLEVPRSRGLIERLAELAGRPGGPAAGEPFPGWEHLTPLVRERTSGLPALLEDALVVWDEPEQIGPAAARLWERLEEQRSETPCPPEKSFFQMAEFEDSLAGRATLALRELEFGEPDADSFHIPSRASMTFHGNMSVAVAETRNLVERGGRVAFFAASVGEMERLADILAEYSVPFQLGLDPSDPVPQYLGERTYLAGPAASTCLIKGGVRRGVVFPDSGLTVFGFDDLFDASELVARQAAAKSRFSAFTSDLADLKPGDLVVHVTHGVGRFLGTRELGEGEQKGDFMLLEYANDARLYVPLTRMDLVQRHSGAGDSKPPLDKLGGATWARTKSRVKARMRDMADELLKLYAERKLAEGFAYSPDSNWQREFEDAFEFTETRDQITAIREIKRDMENSQPMDRLLCGDVGFGKTEVAMRAVFKALGDGKQVALLAPTTVLSFQHFETFRTRFAAFPVRIELLSRFRSRKEQKAVLEDLALGKVDVLIGTHRIFSKDVEFRDLGLLIVDEEQRFGVRHKERLKQLRKDVDVLTMSATPIPRTLHMSLLGMRDMSVIETPPKDRLAIHTVVAHYNEQLIRAAIEQELSRGGQVFFVHNRVDSIWSRAASIQELIPNCRIGVGHGQMTEDALEKVLLGFMRHEYDVFVSTTIVENGLDIPLANTIILENAERYGLSELYQLRGRVGRSNRRAYAYLLVPEDTELSEVARKRLAALKEFSDLGAGFKIAALDLELRGAGNLLGGEQHGHIAAVGFETYVRLLEETVQELKGEEVPLEIHSTLNLGLDIRIPPDYIGDEHQRLRAYKRIAEAGDRGGEVLAELADRYGTPPEAVRNLLEFSFLKTLAQRLGIESVERRQGMANIKFHAGSRIDPAALMDLVRITAGAQFTPAGILRLPADGTAGAASLLRQLKTQLMRLKPPAAPG
ncbi:MAG: transcription-repair coupling factor [Acidobacteria bacterium]|nr:transcription-repair coupling factor [Acidobacteriota bacterium]